jgi:ATP-dependent Clp protease adaptor protein ClpS
LPKLSGRTRALARSAERAPPGSDAFATVNQEIHVPRRPNGPALEKSVVIINLWVANGKVSWAAMAKHEQEGNVLEVQKTRLKPPPLYKVILLNDDYTPMDFVVVVLQTVFAMSREKATQVMLQIHREGMGVCGTYTREVAAAKVDQVLDIARRHQHPLQCTMEET